MARAAAIVTAGFWFEPVSYESNLLGGALSAADIEAIATVARQELAIAFASFRVTLTDRPRRALQRARRPGAGRSSNEA